ncbi:MAG: glycosyltransferase family 2 protein [Frankia sp.]|nr:glycosyltransferase family 2 protein [Frankia sp.]
MVHWGPTEPSARLARWLVGLRRIGAAVVVANDASPRPAGLDDRVHWLVPHRNLGFAGGFVAAVREHPGQEAYLLLNNDIRLTPETVDGCLDLLAADPSVGVVAPALYNSRGLQSGVGTVGRFAVRRSALGTGIGVADAEWVTGAVMMIKGRCLKEVGYDQRFFLNAEDVDFCLRARAAGWRVLVSFHHPAWHEGGATIPSPGYIYYAVRNSMWLARRHGGQLGWLASGARSAALLPRVLAADLLRRHDPRARRAHSALRGLRDGLAPMPSANEPLPDEPRPARWLTW